LAYYYPDVNDFKIYYTRDFNYSVNPEVGVTDGDIQKAQGEAKFNFGSNFASDQSSFSLLFNYLTAHYLVMDMNAASQGTGGSMNWLTSSKSVGSVSESYSIPDRILASPIYAYYAKTYYGTKYLMLIMPYLSGQIFPVCGATRP